MTFRNAAIRTFRILAVAEAFSWAALLIGMYFKWVAGTTELGVQVAGPIHGALFIGYGVTALVLWRVQRWPSMVAVFAGLSAVFPFATILFEALAAREAFPYIEGENPLRVISRLLTGRRPSLALDARSLCPELVGQTDLVAALDQEIARATQAASRSTVARVRPPKAPPRRIACTVTRSTGRP